jgi:cytochrome c-type biogenesis protein CcmH/NrfF
MSFEAVWGFDPDRVIQAVRLPPSEIETEKFTHSAEEQRAARIPSDLHCASS